MKTAEIKKGYYGIGIFHGKSEENFETLWRSACHCPNRRRRMTMNDCIYLDKETGGCKKHSDWSDAMPILEYCLESPCGDYRPLKNDNMDGLISRSAAIEALTDAMCMTGYQSRAIEAVRFLPTIEAEPVRHGRWVDGMPYTNSHWKVCSVCHKSADHPAGGHEYCGRCGAKMDGGANDGHEQG